ncbi:HET-domain-containing protein, partial [Lentinus tigrinus ALCF2SS1-6]
MRLLDTWTGQFHEVENHFEVTYVILSHTWTAAGEQSFQDVRSLTNSVLEDERLSAKIRSACRIAREHGYRYLWLDSCCIDKTSSAELSEAINCMYAWYRDAAVCYAFLSDVPDGDAPRDAYSQFRQSRWFRRGWTLQELIAPRDVIFLSSGWQVLGTKIGLDTVVEEVTSIDRAVLGHQELLHEVSVARRMSWAASRECTRVEDEAYSLMGIFDINMNTLYGEGRRAFVRLQEEVLKRIPDQSLFAWGTPCLTAL